MAKHMDAAVSDRCQAKTYARERCVRRWVSVKRTETGHLHLCRQHAEQKWSLVVWGAEEKSGRCPLCEVSDG